MSEQENHIDLAGLSLDELRALKTQVERSIALRSNLERNRAREQILAIAQNVGIPLRDLLGGSPRAVRAVSAPRGKVAVRYRHPEDSQLQWTGRGRQPKWLVSWLQAGGTLQDLLVATPDAAAAT